MITPGSPFVATVQNEVRTRVHEGLSDLVEVVPALLGNQAGWVGAALLAASHA
jgi:hypothetical protein